MSHAAVQSSADKLGNTFCSYIHNTPFNTNASNDTTYQNNNNVSDITNQNDTLKVPSNISLTSPQKNKNLINNNMFYLTTPTNPYHLTYSITIPNDTIGCVIGRGGARINEIRSCIKKFLKTNLKKFFNTTIFHQLIHNYYSFSNSNNIMSIHFEVRPL